MDSRTFDIGIGDSKNAAVTAMAVLFGLGGLVFAFSDPVEGWPLRIAFATVYFIFTGGVVGFLHPRGWLLAMLVAWGGVLMGGFLTLLALARHGSGAFAAVEPPFVTAGLVMMFGSLAMALAGGVMGKVVRGVVR